MSDISMEKIFFGLGVKNAHNCHTNKSIQLPKQQYIL